MKSVTLTILASAISMTIWAIDNSTGENGPRNSTQKLTRFVKRNFSRTRTRPSRRYLQEHPQRDCVWAQWEEWEEDCPPCIDRINDPQPRQLRYRTPIDRGTRYGSCITNSSQGGLKGFRSLTFSERFEDYDEQNCTDPVPDCIFARAIWTPWKEWTECTGDCKDPGTRNRTRGCYVDDPQKIIKVNEKEMCDSLVNFSRDDSRLEADFEKMSCSEIMAMECDTVLLKGRELEHHSLNFTNMTSAELAEMWEI